MFRIFVFVLPENADTTAAMANDTTTAGPAIDLDTAPASTYTPAPRVEPVLRKTKSNRFNTRFSFSSPGFSESVFFLVSAHVSESVCTKKKKNYHLSASCSNTKIDGFEKFGFQFFQITLHPISMFHEISIFHELLNS